MENIKVLVSCHKKCDLPTDSLYLPIHVGRANSSETIDIQADDRIFGHECDNISSYNNIYCEMTAMYWAWKNIRIIHPDIAYIGLCHYRRYFNFNNHPEYLSYIFGKTKQLIKILLGKKLHNAYHEPIDIIHGFTGREFSISNQKLIRSIKNYDVVTTKEIIMYNTNIRNSFEVIGRVYIDLLESIIKELHPDYYKYLENTLEGRKLSTGNMIILRTDLIDDYCSFVFSVLEEHICRIVKANIISDPYTELAYSRVSGYLSELLTYVYITKKEEEGLKIHRVGKFFVK